MSVIYIIAGPPGIGKSTSGEKYIDPELDILNEDEMRFKYKAKGYEDYNEYSIYRIRDIIKSKLIRNEDFALELNLGFEHQYNYALTLKRFNAANQLRVILFFTDSLQLCLDRAKERHENGLHLVKPDIVTQMFENTLSLFKTNFNHIDHVQFIHADKSNTVISVAEFDMAEKRLTILDDSVSWFRNDLKLFIEQEISPKLNVKPELKQATRNRRRRGPRI